MNNCPDYFAADKDVAKHDGATDDNGISNELQNRTNRVPQWSSLF